MTTALPPPVLSEPPLTNDDLEALLKVDRRTIKRWVAAKQFPEPFYLNNRPRWRQSDVTAFLERVGSNQPVPINVLR
jgi:predicted DNA-binding transcriptional regulator AlpA